MRSKGCAPNFMNMNVIDFVQSIAAYLTTEKHIDPAHVLTVAYGEKAPVADNKTEAGRAKNRRVEILVYKESIGVGAGSSSAVTTAR